MQGQGKISLLKQSLARVMRKRFVRCHVSDESMVSSCGYYGFKQQQYGMLQAANDNMCKAPPPLQGVTQSIVVLSLSKILVATVSL